LSERNPLLDLITVKNLDVYLTDHLAGSVAALELIEHWRERHKEEPLGNFFGRLRSQIRADQDTLRELMHSLRMDESTIRQTGARAAEKMARATLKIAGDEPGLVLALAIAKVPNTSKWGFEEIQRRAEQQIERIEAERISAVPRAFAGTIRSK